jgi:hypothetical protein
MIENPFYSHEFHGDYDLVSIGRLDLEEAAASRTASSRSPPGAS